MNQIEDVFPVEDSDYHCYVTLPECESKEKTSPSWRVIYQNQYPDLFPPPGPDFVSSQRPPQPGITATKV